MNAKLRTPYLVAAFVAGMMYVVACNSVTQGIADAVVAAIDVSFDNASSGLDATTAQSAIDELTARVAALELKMAKTASTDIETLLIGTWIGTEYDAETSALTVQNSDFEISFQTDNTYACSGTTALTNVCPSGTWTIQGMYLELLNGSQSETLTIGNISESDLFINGDDMQDMYSGWVLARQ